MNILFIEDEQELAATAIMQLEGRGYTVYPVYDLVSAREVMADEARVVHLILSDHRLSDGLGIQFAIEMREAFPNCPCAIISGCLTSQDISKLEENQIPYYHKPLLYCKVVEELRMSHLLKAPVPVSMVEEACEPEPCEHGEPEASNAVEPSVEEVPVKDKKLFGIFKRRQSRN